MISTNLPTGFQINWSRFCIITQSTPFLSECYFGFELSFLYCIIFTCNNSLSWACCRAAHTIFANGRTLSFSWKIATGKLNATLCSLFLSTGLSQNQKSILAEETPTIPFRLGKKGCLCHFWPFHHQIKNWTS